MKAKRITKDIWLEILRPTVIALKRVCPGDQVLIDSDSAKVLLAGAFPKARQISYQDVKPAKADHERVAE